MIRVFVFPVLSTFAASYATVVLAQAPMAVHQLQGEYCTALAPDGWSITAENPAGGAFGADLKRADGAAGAGYLIHGVPAAMRSGWYGASYGTPEQAVMTTLTQGGTFSVRCEPPLEVLPGTSVKLMECQNATLGLTGLTMYQVYPMHDGGYVLVMRTACAASAGWEEYGATAAAVARSIRCSVPLRPSAADWTSESPGARARGEDEGDSGYSQWLEMENYHDPSTGQNYWVSPSRDWNENGPQGPGYYTSIGNDIRLFESGYSCPSCTPKAATDDIKNLSGIHAGLPEGHAPPRAPLPPCSPYAFPTTCEQGGPPRMARPE
ncbi:MAG: hypothetical protein ACREYE_30375 [Gammaproteobacteria bacterium]